MSLQKILIVDDDSISSRIIYRHLTKQGFKCVQAHNGDLAFALAREYYPNVIILDVLLPDINGLQLCRLLRQETDTPILFLSCCDEERDKILGLEAGGDDYVTKPFSLAELTARVKALLRRRGLPDEPPSPSRLLEFPGLTIDLARSIAIVNEAVLDLTVKEFQILARLARNPGWVLTSKQLFQLVWETEAIDTRTVAVHINRLRKKLAKVSGNREYILTMWGNGYMFNDKFNAE